jgi:hypothetical protein
VADDKPALPWRPINECPDSDDLYWFLRRDVIDGPRTPESDDIDYWDWFAPCEAPSTTPQPASVVSEDKAKQAFTTWFCLNYPGPHTIISDPNWHAPRIFRQALWSIRNCAAAEPASVVADILTELVAADREYDAADIAASLECRGEREPSKEAVTRLNIAATRREAAITAALQVKP